VKAPVVDSRVESIRKSRGLGASELARRVRVSRQTIYAIEAGTYVPNTEVALRLARELEVSVDQLFSLTEEPPVPADLVTAEVLSASAPLRGQAVRVCQVDSQWVSVPVSALPYYMPEADGIIEKTGPSSKSADLIVFAKEEAAAKRVVLAGCDPAMSHLSRMVERASGVEVIPAGASSRQALEWLTQGKVHIAGSHLEDGTTGEFNLPILRREYPGEDFCVVTFARWEEGLVVAPGNPKSLRNAEDLIRPDVRFVNRERGSGSRALLDTLLAKAGADGSDVHGYDRIAYGHLQAAHAVLSGAADVCLATRCAARAFDLDFVPLREARYDLVMRRRTTDHPAVMAFLDVLQRSALRRKLESLAGYDVSETGSRRA
jgi:putative molybdopterin biosynthesis protein